MTLPGFPDATPLAGLAGGVLIGLAGIVLLIGAGRVIGVSGLASRAFGLGGSTLGTVPAWAFLIGLPLGAWIVTSIRGIPQFEFTGPLPLVVAGLVVGFGARLGSGCTSGHGVCGVSRLSRRSLVATALFMSSGIATVALMNLAGLEVLR